MTSSTTKNYVYAAPNGSDGAPSFRKLVAADIPGLAASKITSGTLSSSRLPISTAQTNSTTKVPSSSLVYSMNQKISELDDAITELENGASTKSITESSTYTPQPNAAPAVGTLTAQFVVSHSPVNVTSVTVESCSIQISTGGSIRISSISTITYSGNTITVKFLTSNSNSGYLSGTLTCDIEYQYIY